MILLLFCMPDDWKNFPQTGFWLHIFQIMFLLYHARIFSGKSYRSLTCNHASSSLTLLCHVLVSQWVIGVHLEAISTPQLAKELLMDMTANNVNIPLCPTQKWIPNLHLCTLFSKRPVATPVLLNIKENVSRGGESGQRKQPSLPEIKIFYFYTFYKSK